jgi:glyoxylase-like metal-dependent hydrolase (beta-lactamase superfamily II)
MIEVIPGVYRLNDRFVNLYLVVEPDALTLIDAGIAGSAVKLVLRTIAQLNRRPEHLRRVLITHADPDHYGGANELRRATGARIHASAREAVAMARGVMSREVGGNAWVRGVFGLFGRLMPMSPRPVDEILSPGQVLPVLGALNVIASPGHTPDHISFYAPAQRLLFAGDSLNAMGGKLRFVDGPVTWDYRRGLQSVREQAALGAEVIAAGHGPVIRGKAALDACCTAQVS